MNKLDTVFDRGVDQILPTKGGLQALMNKRKITLYQGVDPTAKSLHLGHLVGIRKLAQFQDLGHRVIFLIGDFTGMIGDPSGKMVGRKPLSKEEVIENAKTYKNQVSGILEFSGENPVEIKYNSEWLAKMSAIEFLQLAQNLTAQQVMERDMFQKRLKAGQDVYMNEFLYPFMQGFDSVAMKVDLEIGGNDQLFNMLMGRKLMRSILKKEKFVMTLKLLEDPSGKKMGKTEENAVNLTDKPSQMFGKIMSLPDSLIDPGIELLTDLPLNFAQKLTPLEAKKRLAFEVVSQVKGEKKAKEALVAFERTFQKRKPTYQNEVSLKLPTNLKAAVAMASSASISQAKRLISQEAVDVNEKTVTDQDFIVEEGDKLKIGKITFVSLKGK